MKEKLYVAYGSNLNIRQMKYRCPTAKLYGVGELKDYELQFKGYPNSAYATIAPKVGSSVPIAVWKITSLDESSLDRYEGYPSHYYKENVSVNLGNKSLDAMVYIMNPKMDFALPSAGYYRTVHEGYLDCKLDVDVLNDAVGRSAAEFYKGKMAEYFDVDEDEDEEYDEDDDESFGMEL